MTCVNLRSGRVGNGIGKYLPARTESLLILPSTASGVPVGELSQEGSMNVYLGLIFYQGVGNLVWMHSSSVDHVWETLSDFDAGRDLAQDWLHGSGGERNSVCSISAI